MTTYNTGNPIGSTDARDLYDNVQNLDHMANSAASTYADRFGVQRKTLAGIDAEAGSRMNALDTAAATQRTGIQNAADLVLDSIGYAPPVAYAAGISLTLQTQTVEYDGEIYAPKVSSLPFATGGTFETSKFRLLNASDAVRINYSPETGSLTNLQTALRNLESGRISGNATKKHFSIGCIPRCTAGVFALLDDAAHHPMNVSSVTQPDAYNIRVNYSNTASKINSFVAAPDDALAAFGVVFGGDVGTSYANIRAYAPFSFYCDHNTPTPYILTNALWAPSVTSGAITITKPDGATVRVTHPATISNDAVVATIVNGSALLTPVVSFNAGQIDIIMHSDAQGYVFYNGTTWSQSNSDNLNYPTLTWTASNTLRVDHGYSGSVNKSHAVTGHGGLCIPQVMTVGATYFEVGFFDYAGTQLTVPSALMQFWYRLDLLVPTKWPDSMIVSVMRGPCPVPSENFSNVLGNNIWVIGNMEA